MNSGSIFSSLHCRFPASSRQFHLHSHLYADDMPIYGFCTPSASFELQNRVSACVAEVSLWLLSNGLQLNPAKTEILWLTSSRKQIQIPQVPFCIRTATIALSNLSITTHIFKTVSNCFSVMRLIHSVYRSVSTVVLLLLATALVLLCVDYGNAMLALLPACQHCRLQSVLRAAAQIVSSTQKFDHVTPLLRELYWLRIPEQITFKRSCLVFRSLNGTTPVYLANSINCITDVTTRRSLRSSLSTAIVVPVTHCSTIGIALSRLLMEQSTIVCHVIIITVDF